MKKRLTVFDSNPNEASTIHADIPQSLEKQEPQKRMVKSETSSSS